MEALANAGFRTAVLFERAKAIDQSSEAARRLAWPAAKLAVEADRFQLWAVNLGLFVSGHASLDYRVRDAESIRLVILRFIASLGNALTEGLLPASPGHGIALIIVISPRVLQRPGVPDSP